MDRPKLEVANVLRHYGEAYRQEHGASLSTAQRRVLTAIEVCRTAVLGGHLEQCHHCAQRRNAYGRLKTIRNKVRGPKNWLSPLARKLAKGRKLLILRHAPRWNRTNNPVIKSHLLCQLS